MILNVKAANIFSMGVQNSNLGLMTKIVGSQAGRESALQSAEFKKQNQKTHTLPEVGLKPATFELNTSL